MHTTFSADVIDLDKPIRDAFAERPGKPLKLRIQPTLLRAGKAGAGTRHEAWTNVRWLLECHSVEEAQALREAMRAFFAALGQVGPAAVTERLQWQPAGVGKG